MSGKTHRLAWVPPFLVGAAAAIAAEVAISILLYAGAGFLRSLTVILAVEGAALAGGLWSAPTHGPGIVDRLRRRWLLCLTAFLAATIYGGVWSLDGALRGVDALTDGRLGQGLGLALLAAFPLFAAGAVLGGLGPATANAGSTPRGSGAAAASGAALGFVLTGLLLPRAPLPASLLVACIVMLSLGGMIFGVVLGSKVDVRVRAERRSSGTLLRVEDRVSLGENVGDRVLLEGSHERRRLPLQSERAATAPWDVAVARLLMPEPGRPWRVLSLGGGASGLARTVLREHPTGSVDVLERSASLVELGAEHFGTELEVGEGDRVRVLAGNLEDLLQGVQGPYDAVLVDATALAPVGGARSLSRLARTKLVEALGPRGVLVWGPTRPSPGVSELVEGWPVNVFERAAPAVLLPDAAVDRREAVDGPRREVVILTGRAALELPTAFDGFTSLNGRPDMAT